MSDNQQIGIEIDCSREFENNVKELKLREVYQIHSDIVQECIKKAILFNPEYMTDLFNAYNGLFESEEELPATIYFYAYLLVIRQEIHSINKKIKRQ